MPAVAARLAIGILMAAIAVVAGLAAKSLLLGIGVDTVYLPLVVPVAVVAWRYGAIPGLAATLVAGLGDLELFGPARTTGPGWAAAVQLAAFFVVGATISLLAEVRIRSSRRELASQQASSLARAEADRATRQLVGLEALLERLAPTTSSEQVADALLTQGVPLIGATAGAMFVLSADRGRARVFGDGEGAGSADVVVHEHPALADTLMLGTAFWDRVPGSVGATPAGPPDALVPIRGRGSVIGALALCWRQGLPPDATGRAFVEAVVAQGGQALERALLFEAERQLLHETETSREEAVRLRDELRAVLQSIGEPILVVAPSGAVTLANRAAEHLLGSIARVDDLRERLRPLADATLDLDPGDPAEVRLDGTDRILSMTVFGVQGRPSGSRVVAISDVTAIRRAEEAREVFIGVLSHELRTPVTTILGGIDLLARDLTAADRREVMDGVTAESERLRRLVEDVLVLSRFERDALQVEDEPVLVHHVVTSTAAQEARRTDPPAVVRVELAEDLPPVRADATYLEQILRNLIGNAVKYGGKDGPIDVCAMRRGDLVEVIVSDAGPGFPADDAERLFELFYRSHRTAAKPGAGIGLFVARQLARSMGGELAARPRRGGGAEFALTLRALSTPEDLHGIPRVGHRRRKVAAPSDSAVL